MDDEWTTSYHLAGFVGILPVPPLLLLTAPSRPWPRTPQQRAHGRDGLAVTATTRGQLEGRLLPC
jgi:hypothetical protein